MHLAVSAILFAAGVDAKEAELAEAKSETENRKNSGREDENKPLD
jgi:hypothetical protein